MTVQFAVRGVLLDIEGTTSSIRFVHDEMFPYARRGLRPYLAERWGGRALERGLDVIARDAGHPSLAGWCAGLSDDASRDRVAAHVERLMDADSKATGLKALQGLIWESGFRGGALRAHLYEDVEPALRAWALAGIDVRIYSSGSVQTQRLFFAHTIAGDLSPLLRGHFDTTTGAKKAPESYTTIAAAYDLPPTQLLFISDVADELDAAQRAGFRTALSQRPENPPVPVGVGHPRIGGFGDVVMTDIPYRDAPKG